MRYGMLAFVLLAACFDTEVAPPPPPEPARVVPAEPVEMDSEWEGEGLRIRLSEAELAPVGPGSQPTAPTEVEVLSESRVRALLERAPELEAQEGDRQTVSLRPATKPPPRTGATELMAFPPPPTPDLAPTVEQGPLRVTRHAPEGLVPIAPHASLSFSQPMVALTSQDEAARTVPVEITPEPSGQWRWAGTRTLLFEPDPRFPMATEYALTVPAGTTSATGGTLDEAVSWTFATPAVGVQHGWPSSGPHPIEPVLYLGLDQDVDAAALLPSVHLRAGRAEVPLRQATQDEIDGDERVSRLVEGAQEGRWLALAPTEPLEPDTTYSLDLDAGAPSAEGPRLTSQRQSTEFFTYPPLRVDDHDCSWGLDGCAPGGTLWVWMNNPLMADQDTAGIRLEPEVEGLRVELQGYGITVQGDTAPRTTYQLVLPAGLQDAFGQTLGKDQRIRFEVGSAEQSLQGPPTEVVVLDPAGPPALSVWSTNHRKLRVTAWSVTPQDYPAVSKWMREARWDGYHGAFPVSGSSQHAVEVGAYVQDELVETPIDLSEWLPESGLGHVFVKVEPTVQPRDAWNRVEIYAWVQRTELGLTALVDYGQVLGWATSLRQGTPMEGVQLSLLGLEQEVSTDADGLGILEPYADRESGPHVLVARKGDDVALLPDGMGWWNQSGAWTRAEPGPGLSWFSFDDRAMYRPGETVRIKGWIRSHDGGRGGGVRPLEGGPQTVHWTARDAWNNTLGEGDVTIGDFGGFDLELELPGTPALGWARVDFLAEGGDWRNASWAHGFQIQEFRRPEFEVGITADPGPYVLGEHAWLTVEAGYYAGGALPSAPVAWQATWSDTWFSPPGHPEFSFGQGGFGFGISGIGWSGGGGLAGLLGYWGGPAAAPQMETLQGTTDAQGQHTLKADFLAMDFPKARSVHFEATVTDVNRQGWTASHDLILHPASLYPGLRTDKAFYEEGSDVEVELLAVDLEGEVVPEVALSLSLERMEWKRVDGVWSEVPVETRECERTSASQAVSCGFEALDGGTWHATVRLEDEEGRPNESTMTLWVSGWDQPPQRAVAMEEVQLVPDQDQYQPGETARVLVVSPFTPAWGLATVQRGGVMVTEPFYMEGSTHTLELPVGEEHVPGATLQVDLVGAAVRVDDEGEPLPDKARRVAYAQGTLSLSVPPLGRTLTVEVSPEVEALQPGGHTQVGVSVRDARGKPVQAEVALVVVDESVLALTGMATPDPLAAFYVLEGGGVQAQHGRGYVVLADPHSTMDADQAMRSNPGAAGVLGVLSGSSGQGLGGLGIRGVGEGGGGYGAGAGSLGDVGGVDMLPPPMPMEADKSMAEAPLMSAHVETRTSSNRAGGASPAITVREDLSATALFAPHVHTNAAGEATVPLDLPDSLTRYRIMAVAVDHGVGFGAGESTLTARLPLMLRPSPPRFLSFGDRAELPLVVQNTTGSPVEVELALGMTNAVAIPSVQAVPMGSESRLAGRAFTVPAHDRREVRVPIAADMAGTARFQAVVAAGRDSDAARFDFPVYTPATTEAFAVYGEVDEGAVLQPVQAPPDAWPQVGGLEITTSSTQLQALTDAVIYLADYPYDCSEQIASRVLALAALRDVLDAFEADQLQDAATLEAAVDRDLSRLQRRQMGHGGWGYWSGLRDDPYVTVHVAHALSKAQDKGYDLPEGVLPRAQRYLVRIRTHIPWWYSDHAEWSVRAYALYVRHLMGDTDSGQARALLHEAGVEGLPLEAQGWLAPVLHASGDEANVQRLITHWENRATETASGAEFAAAYTDTQDYVLLHSSRRTDAVLLDSLLLVRPEHELIPKVVRSLLGHRVEGRWSSTQENSLVLVAMDRYFRVAEGVEPDFVARIWLGDDFVGEHAFQGRTTERSHALVPMGMLTDPPGPRDLVVAKEGAGRMYYRLGLRYVPRDLRQEPADRGFEVSRVYEAVDDEGDVRQDEDGTWHIQSGALVRVRVQMIAPSRRTHVALVDPLPAGLEPMNPDLAVTGSVPQDPKAQVANRYWWWASTWWEHDNLRDERVEAFTTLLWPGVHEYSYVATATTPGRYVVGPPKAEEMYHPETSGRGATDLVWVE